ncbi:ABC transporter substrate-binding protein [Aquamicrobium sp. LC103]|uniref:ABC transporter substrate-binding protein n=1 Tax=Aquamicrobium sp. LC103 TaxID=1120658 RepID=UPI00063E9358|nr:ABC transporter substrate-binding protein [Aquamicrobium sp. LC103]TKT75695.1 ABC transporter substrate-binding protein [Aquamicrobium sp. LC103]
MKTGRKLSIVAAVMMVAMSSASAASLKIGLQDDPDALDPALGGTYAGRIVFEALCDKLVDIDGDLEIVPKLATEWRWNDASTELTLKLREGVVYHDGTAFDAESVKANIERMQTLAESKRKGELSPIKEVEVVDAHTVIFKLDTPFAPLLSVLTDRAGMMVSTAAAAAAGDNFATAPVCSGPFKFADRKARDSISLEKFADYWNADAIGYDSIEYLILPDSTVRLSRLQAGDLDVAERVAPTDIQTVKGDNRLALHESPGLGISHLFINVRADSGSALAEHPELRQALELSLDRAAINQVAFNGAFTADNQMLTPLSAFHSKDRPMPARDVAKAKELIASTGVEAPAIEITYENSLTDGRVAQIIQAMAGEAGFKVELLPLETSSAIERYLAGNFQLYIGNWSGRADPDPTLNTFFGSAGSQNLNGYSNPELDELLDQARREVRQEERVTLYNKVTDILLNDLPTVPLYHPSWFYGAQASIEGINIYPDGLLRVTGVKPAN